MSLQRTKQQYKSFKNICTILESGDIHDDRYKLLIRSLKVDDVEKMRTFVHRAEDLGIQYLYESN